MADTTPDFRIATDLNLEKLEGILKNKPDDPSVLFALGETAFRRGRNLIALSAYHRLLELTPKMLEVHLALAKIFFDQRMFEESFREIAETFERDSENVEARVLYEIFIREARPSEPLGARLTPHIRKSFDAKRAQRYMEQLAIERDWLAGDQREITTLLKTSPMETFLEYSQAIVSRKLALLEELLAKTEELTGIAPEGRKAVQAAVGHRGKKSQSKPEFSLAHRGRLLVEFVEAVDPFLQKIKGVKGVLGSFVAGAKGEVFHSALSEPVNAKEIARHLAAGLELFSQFALNPVFWVLEYQQSLVVIQKIAPRLFLLIMAGAPLTFGALRYTLEKNLPLIQEALATLEVSALES